MIKFLYRLYQLFIAAPLCLVATLITALAVIIGCTLGNGHFWGYYPGRWWSQFIIRVLLLPVKVEGREHLAKGQSYVFVSNHQGAFDIFLIYGFLGRNFKWMMKHQLRSLPLASASRMSKRERRCATACRSWCFLKEPARSQATWGSSVAVPSCSPMSCSCPFVR